LPPEERVKYELGMAGIAGGLEQGRQESASARARQQTGPTQPYLEGARGEFRTGMGSMLGQRYTGMQQAWGTMEPMVESRVNLLRGRPEQEAVRGRFVQGLNPANIQAERQRLYSQSVASVRAAERRDMRTLQDEMPNLSPEEQRRYSRKIRETYADMMAALPVEVDKQMAERESTMLGQASSYAQGMYSPEMNMLNNLLSQAGQFGLTPDQERAMRQALMEMAKTGTVGSQGAGRMPPMGGNLTGGQQTYRGSTRLRRF